MEVEIPTLLVELGAAVALALALEPPDALAAAIAWAGPVSECAQLVQVDPKTQVRKMAADSARKHRGVFLDRFMRPSQGLSSTLKLSKPRINEVRKRGGSSGARTN
jgi:hypothetical protein